MEWYQTGEEGHERAKQFDNEREKRRQEKLDKPRRFWNKPDGEGRDIVFLDTAGFFFKEHNYRADGHFRNWETCIQDLGSDCPACEAGNVPSYVCAHTIIELTEFENKQGQVIRNPKRLLVTKGIAREKVVKAKARQKDDLVGCVFEVTRYKVKECNTGEDFEVKQRLSREQLEQLVPSGNDVEKYLEPYNYREIFSPKTVEELRNIFGVEAPIGVEDGDNSNSSSPSQPKSTLADVL